MELDETQKRALKLVSIATLLGILITVMLVSTFSIRRPQALGSTLEACLSLLAVVVAAYLSAV